MPEEPTISTKRIFEGRAFRVRVDTISTRSSGQTTREIVEHEQCVAMIVLDDQDNTLLVRQYRKSLEKALLEIPAGGIDPGESPDDAVRRELQEEIGLLPRNIERLGGFYSSPGYSTEYLYLYLCTDLVPGRLTAEDTASIEVVKVPLARIPELITSGEICDSKSVAGLLRVICERSTRA
jgi:ADP-ribose pyrophosphatase